MSLLFEAVKNNDLKALKLALKEKNAPDDLKGALKNAAEQGYLALVKCLVYSGVRDDWAIVAAASFAKTALVRFLYKECKGNLNAALIGAAAHGRLENVRFLLTTEADSLNEALADAVLRNQYKIVRLLLKKGADPFARVYAGQTAMRMAERKKDRKMVALLHQHIENKKKIL